MLTTDFKTYVVLHKQRVCSTMCKQFVSDRRYL